MKIIDADKFLKCWKKKQLNICVDMKQAERSDKECTKKI